jgi:hypothetical protein
MLQDTHQKWQSQQQRIRNEPDTTLSIVSRPCPKWLLPFRGFDSQAPRMRLRLSRWTFLRNHRFDGKSRKIVSHGVFDEWISRFHLVVESGGEDI